MRDSLEPQDNLYTLVERSAADEKVTVVGSLPRVIFAGESSAALLDAIDQPGSARTPVSQAPWWIASRP
jgi:mannitol 2-dehydrogenase